jgi:cell wall-associated NlpC family hydrolase
VTGRPRVALAAALALSVGSWLAVVAPTADASHGAPSAGALRHSKAVVASRQHKLAALAGRVARARANARRLGEAADAASEVYDGARVKQQAADAALHTAQLVLAGANQRVHAGEKAISAFAAAAYESGGAATAQALLSGASPSSVVGRIGALGAVSASQHSTLEQLTAAKIYQGVVQRRAESVAAQAQAAAATANRARLAAQQAADRQQTLLGRLQHGRHRLTTLLATAKAHESTLAREHLEAVLAARRAAARRSVQQQSPPTPVSSGPSPFANRSSSTSGTISAATGEAAVHIAEAQIGKPYQWGGAGPSTFDCSGLVMWSYDQIGVHLDHWTGDQWVEGAHISRSELRPGDLVFFAYNTSDPNTIHHVGMYIGGGQMVEAPFTGADVRISSAFRPDYIGAVRPFQR